MEVQFRDSVYNLYPVQNAKIYFHNYILTSDGYIKSEEFSETISCPNS